MFVGNIRAEQVGDMYMFLGNIRTEFGVGMFLGNKLELFMFLWETYMPRNYR